MKVKKEDVFPSLYSRRGKGAAKKELEVFLVLLLMFLAVCVAVYTLPEDFLTRNPVLMRGIEYMSICVPSIERFGNMSDFPEVAQTVFAAELFLVPLIVLWMFKSFGFNVSQMPAARWRVLLAIPFSLIMIWAILVYVPGTPDGAAPSSRISKALLHSRLGFSFWSVVMTLALSVFISLTFAWIKSVPEIFGFYRK